MQMKSQTALIHSYLHPKLIESRWERYASKGFSMGGLRSMKKWLAAAVLISIVLLLVFRSELLEQSGVQSGLRNPTATKSSPSTLHVKAEKASKSTAAPELSVVKFKRSPLFISDYQDDLIRSSTNSTSGYAMVSIWNHIEPAFYRPDCFPDATKGLKEAETAWLELMEELKSETLLEKNSSGGWNDGKQCPYSVSFINGTGLESKDAGLQIPCGLVVDSSITIVGFPWGAEGNFVIELVGPKLPGEQDAPIILHYNVRLQGDKLTDNPVIVQNTWTKEHDWEDEERCPLASEEKTRVVDGLDACSEQVGKAAITRKLNGSENAKTSKWPPLAAGTGKKIQFPFVNGFPFAATLWIGWEGFHMTANGKHITSFEYRKNLEPSLVNGIRLGGNLKLISLMANGLPTSEDISKIVNLEFLKAPPSSSKIGIELFIGVFSTGNNFDRRMAVRRSWMQYDAVRSGSVVVRFFVGLNNNKQVNRELWLEASTYGDVQLMPFVDYYDLITLKTIAICIFGTKMVNAKYIMKTDDDTFVRIDEVLATLNKANHGKGVYCGSLEFDSQPHRAENDKWFISQEEYSAQFYPPWAHGPGYIISRDIAKFVVQSHKEKTLKLFKLEDVSMGLWVEEYQKQGHKVHYTHDDRFYNVDCQDNYITAHYQSPKNMACLWQNILKGSGPICCE